MVRERSTTSNVKKRIKNNTYAYQYKDEESVKSYLISLKKALIENDIEDKLKNIPNVILKKNENKILIPIIENENSLMNYICELVIEIDDTTHNKEFLKTYANQLSQIVYLLGRINSRYYAPPTDALKNISKTMVEILSEKGAREIDYFLFRTICITLIKLGSEETRKIYIEHLLTNEIARKINVAFHLEYYGDIASCNKNFEDDPKKGTETIKHIAETLDKYEISSKKVLELITLCDLIERRIDNYLLTNDIEIKKILETELIINKKTYDIVSYCLSIIENYKGKTFIYEDKKMVSFLEMVWEKVKEYSIIIKKMNYDYNIELNEARSGWKKREIIGNRESISAHMYNAWLMGKVFLPNECDENGYDKNKILELLLVHDLGEICVGDIIHGEKNDNEKRNEKEFIQMWLNKYDSSFELYELWKQAEGFVDSDISINAKVAKEIDYIQGFFQFCCYCYENKCPYGKYEFLADWKKWIEQINSVKTDIGNQVLNKVIWNNPRFKNPQEYASDNGAKKEFLIKMKEKNK